MEFQSAPDPSDLIWENLETSEKQIKCGKCCTTIAIIFFLLLSSLLFYTLKQVSNDNMFKYPNNIYCKASIIPQITYDSKGFKSYVPKNANDTKFKQFKLFHDLAEIDKPFTQKQKGSGFYQCFCKK